MRGRCMGEGVVLNPLIKSQSSVSLCLRTVTFTNASTIILLFFILFFTFCHVPFPGCNISYYSLNTPISTEYGLLIFFSQV
jgi:hypothetical protein